MTAAATSQGDEVRTMTDMQPRAARLERSLAMQLAAEEYERFAATLRGLTPAQWSAQTDCPAWDVRAMAAHCLGMVEYAASPEEAARQQGAAAAAVSAAGGVFIDALTGLQVTERAHLSADEVIASYAAQSPAAMGVRMHMPDEVRQMELPQVINGKPDVWTLGYLADVILTRDTWMHRVDICRATGAHLTLTPEHDGVLIDDVVNEWAERHGSSYELILDGPAGGHWSAGSGGPSYHLDAVEFCRILSGRAAGDGLLSTEVPF